MMLDAFETRYDGEPPAWLRKVEAEALMEGFAEAFDVEPPQLESLSADEALAAFREFTAACMDAASEDAGVAARYRARLGERAYDLGVKVRSLLMVRRSQALHVTRFFYRGIGIELTGELPGALRFGSCSFAQRYTPANCWFMSAFDEGFMRGMMGDRKAECSLSFTCRLTEGAPCCRAHMGNDTLPQRYCII